jgi:hypothetical protein
MTLSIINNRLDQFFLKRKEDGEEEKLVLFMRGTMAKNRPGLQKALILYRVNSTPMNLYHAACECNLKKLRDFISEEKLTSKCICIA